MIDTDDNDFERASKLNRYNTAQWYFNMLRTNKVAVALPEWDMVCDHGRVLELHYMQYGVLGDIELYCQGITDVLNQVFELEMESYWKPTLDALQEL